MVEKHVGVAHQDDGIILLGFLEGIVRLLFGGLLFGLLVGIFLVLILLFLLFLFGLAVREGGLESAGQANGEGIGGAGGLKILHDVFTGKLSHKTIDKLRLGSAL